MKNRISDMSLNGILTDFRRFFECSRQMRNPFEWIGIAHIIVPASRRFQRGTVDQYAIEELVHRSCEGETGAGLALETGDSSYTYTLG